MRPGPKRGRRETALWLLRNGLHPVVIRPREKRPIGPSWGATYPTRDGLLDAFDRHKGAGVGIALGPAAGVVDFEIDDAETAPRIELPPSLGWSSRRGPHRLFLWDERLDGLPATVRIGGAELRIGGRGKQTMSVCPPSVGDDRRCRRWNQCWEVRALPECLLKAVERGNDRQHGHATGQGPLLRPVSGGSRYAEAALRYEAKAVATAKEGTRNSTLNKAAFSLGGLIAAGLLPRDLVEELLSDAASSAGLGDREIAATLKCAIDAGIARPRKV